MDEGVKRYRFAKDYSSGRGVWTAGQEVDVTPSEAAWFNRDVPDCLEAVEEKKATKAEAEPEPDARAADKPPVDRQVKAPESKRGA